jgi:adenylate cyclase, class 2
LEAGRVNVELKARDPDPQRSVETCATIGAEAIGVLAQRDTYFGVPSGRLKLREEEAGAELISYERPNDVGSRESRYRIVAVERTAEMRALLTDALGAIVVVSKRRQLFLWQGVRIHLDEVEGLGHFLELEAIAEEGSDLTEERVKVAQLRSRFEIADGALIGVSYADLLI